MSTSVNNEMWVKLRSLVHLMFGGFRRMPASTKGRMFIRTPSLRSGFQPIGSSERGFHRTMMS